MDTSAEIPGALNGTIADLLRDFAEVQSSPQKKWGYKRAAKTLRNLDEPIEQLLQADGTLQRIPNIGPASTRIILEVLHTGTSTTVEQAVQESGRRVKLQERRTQRSNFLTRAQALQVLRGSPNASRLAARYRGDLQMHSTWSDGSQTLEDIIVSRLERSYTFSAVTDHSYGLPIAGGLSMERLAAQHVEIDGLNRKYAGQFRLLKGIEANILADGSVDMRPEELQQLEIVVAAPHSVLRSPIDQTGRLVRAVETRGVHILGHPRGRMYSSRGGLQVERWTEVFAAAARAEVAIEIDGDPSRQDLDYTLAAQALEAGCLLAVDTDAHSVWDMRYVDIALAHAALAGATPEQIINCWDLDRLLEWAT